MANIKPATVLPGTITSENSPVVLLLGDTHESVIKGFTVENTGLGDFQMEFSSSGEAFGDPRIIGVGATRTINSLNAGNELMVDQVRITHLGTDSSFIVEGSSVHITVSTGNRKTSKIELAVDVQTDSNDSCIQYIGKAVTGSLTSDAVWQIKRIDDNSGIVITWADGDDNFNNVYDNREALIYS